MLYPPETAGHPGPGPLESSYSGGGEGNLSQCRPAKDLVQSVAATGRRTGSLGRPQHPDKDGQELKQNTKELPLSSSISPANTQRPVRSVYSWERSKRKEGDPLNTDAKGRPTAKGGTGSWGRHSGSSALTLTQHKEKRGIGSLWYAEGGHGNNRTHTHLTPRWRPSKIRCVATSVSEHQSPHSLLQRLAHYGPETKCSPWTISVQAVSLWSLHFKAIFLKRERRGEEDYAAETIYGPKDIYYPAHYRKRLLYCPARDVHHSIRNYDDKAGETKGPQWSDKVTHRARPGDDPATGVTRKGIWTEQDS